MFAGGTSMIILQHSFTFKSHNFLLFVNEQVLQWITKNMLPIIFESSLSFILLRFACTGRCKFQVMKSGEIVYISYTVSK